MRATPSPTSPLYRHEPRGYIDSLAVKYLLDAPDDEMVEWKAAAREAGVSFAEWLRQHVREGVRRESEQAVVHEPEPAAARGAQTGAARPLGPAVVDVTITGAAVPVEVVTPAQPKKVGLRVIAGGKTFKGPDPKPGGKGK